MNHSFHGRNTKESPSTQSPLSPTPTSHLLSPLTSEEMKYSHTTHHHARDVNVDADDDDNPSQWCDSEGEEGMDFKKRSVTHSDGEKGKGKGKGKGDGMGWDGARRDVTRRGGMPFRSLSHLRGSS